MSKQKKKVSKGAAKGPDSKAKCSTDKDDDLDAILREEFEANLSSIRVAPAAPATSLLPFNASDCPHNARDNYLASYRNSRYKDCWEGIMSCLQPDLLATNQNVRMKLLESIKSMKLAVQKPFQEPRLEAILEIAYKTAHSQIQYLELKSNYRPRQNIPLLISTMISDNIEMASFGERGLHASSENIKSLLTQASNQYEIPLTFYPVMSRGYLLQGKKALYTC